MQIHPSHGAARSSRSRTDRAPAPMRGTNNRRLTQPVLDMKASRQEQLHTHGDVCTPAGTTLAARGGGQKNRWNPWQAAAIPIALLHAIPPMCAHLPRAHACCLQCASALSNLACLVAGGAVRGVVGLNGRGAWGVRVRQPPALSRAGS
ncbi:hypothetical protein EON66_11315 [archaeon]|nr:MAG: hypothetical protein EON66_11315 [archaeon]